MIGKSNAVSGGSEYDFSYNYQGAFGSEQPTLNGKPISLGETVKIPSGMINVLYSPNEGMSLLTEDGTEIPYEQVSQPQVTRASFPFFYFRFVMPSQNVSAEYVV